MMVVSMVAMMVLMKVKGSELLLVLELAYLVDMLVPMMALE